MPLETNWKISFDSYGSPEWAAMQGRLIAYASDAVRERTGVAMQAAG